jgi:hypothetical protein
MSLRIDDFPESYFMHKMACHVVAVGADTDIEDAFVVCSCGWWRSCGRFGVQTGEAGGLTWVMDRYAEHLSASKKGYDK